MFQIESSTNRQVIGKEIAHLGCQRETRSAVAVGLLTIVYPFG